MIDILLVDDQNLFMDGLIAVFKARAPDFNIIGAAVNGQEAADFLGKSLPHLIIMDVRMPVMDGVEATKIIHAKYPQILIMMLTTFDDDEYVFKALQNGATGYMLKDIPPNELIAAIRAVFSGAISLSPSIVNKLIQIDDYKTIQKELMKKNEYFESLNTKEREIFNLIGAGYSNNQIAEKVCLAEQTVKNYLSIIYKKLYVNNRIEAIQLINELKGANTG